MEIIKAKRGRVKGMVTRIASYCESIDDDTPLESLQERLDKLNEAWTEFGQIQNQMYQFCNEPGYVDQEVENEQFESKYFSAKVQLSQAIKERQNREPIDPNAVNRLADQQASFLEKFTRTCVNSATSDTKLPKITIPSFSGNYAEWVSFRDLYIGTVHDNSNLTDTQKFHYLKGLLKDEAAGLLRHIPISEDNYQQAWERLNKRYNKTNQIVKSFIKNFLSLPSLSNPSAHALRKLSDGSDELIRGLKALGSKAEERDPWIIYLLLNKVDSNTRQYWAEETTDVEFPTIQQLLDFLDKRCRALEDSQPPLRNPHSTYKQTNSSSIVKSLHSSSNSSCPKCKGEHSLFHCPVFQSSDVVSRRNLVSDSRLCFNCLRPGHTSSLCKSKQSCRRCHRRHHTLVHMQQDYNQSHLEPSHKVSHASKINLSSPGSSSAAIITPENSEVTPKQPLLYENNQTYPTVLSTHSISHQISHPISLLPTALVHLQDSRGQIHTCRILLDSGSQVSFVTDSCVRRLGLRRKHAKIHVTGVSSTGAGTTKGVVELQLFSRVNSKSIFINAFILNRITSLLPSTNLNTNSLEGFSSLSLADPTYNVAGPIDILLGADKIFHVMEEGCIKSDEFGPVAQLTIFGWVIAGNIINHLNNHDNISSSICTYYSELDIDASIQRFWEIENISNEATFTPDEQAAETNFVQTHTRSGDGRYVVELPFKGSPLILGDNFSAAMARLQSMEQRFQKNFKLKQEYHKFMQEYLTMGHMKLIPNNEINTDTHAYLPHHAVFKLDSSTTKLRVVFDGSYKTPSGISLNDILLIGPPIQRDLLSVCLRFRRHKYAFTADIEKMFRQIWVSQKHLDFQRILWRFSSDDPIQHYRLTTVTYGTACAPFLAVRTLQQLASDYQDILPRASKAIRESFYVDDVMTGADSTGDVISLKDDLIRLLENAGFKLRKFSSNCWPLLTSLPQEHCELSPLEIKDDSKSVKALGLQWFPAVDTFSFKVSLPCEMLATKRKILSDASRIFDPLGFLTPVTVAIKIFLQQLWLHNLDWDDLIPDSLAARWMILRNDLANVEKLHIPRHIWTSAKDIELHGFSDASENAFAAVIYCRSRDQNGVFHIRLIAAKSKVAPLKQISLPRLELCASVMLSRLFVKIRDSLVVPSCKIFAWTDSQIVLHWLSSVPRRWKSFIANRTAEILETLPRQHWRHVKSSSNPADCASRGILASNLMSHELWWQGPHWLQDTPEGWITSNAISQNEEVDAKTEERSNFVQAFVVEHKESLLDELIAKFSNWIRLLRVYASCLRYVHNLKNRACPHLRRSGSLQADEIKYASRLLTLHVQRLAFSSELQKLRNNRQLTLKSQLVKLSPFLDDQGILRVGGRIQHSALSFKTKHPIILPKSHAFTRLIIKYYHNQNCHAGASELLVILRQEYWILGCRNMVRKIIHECMSCFRQRQTSVHQMMGDLPAQRINYARPFSQVGIDYAGPLILRLHRGRNSRHTKGYICLFVCFTTKALHLELVSDLTTDAFLAALKRFIARRGKCVHIYSDNGTNFKGAQRKLSEMHALLQSESHNNIVQDYLSMDGIMWSFIPPAAPHFGGLWEASVKSVKTHMKRVIGNNVLTYEETYTVLTQIEALLNSRPLCPISDHDLDILTPAHFLIGQPYTALPEPDLSNIPQSRLKNWELLQNMMRGFWKRWHLEYLTSLQQRAKWCTPAKEISVGDLVVLKEPNLPPSKWALARVEEIHPGPDGLSRVFTIRSVNGRHLRPITKIVPLPMK